MKASLFKALIAATLVITASCSNSGSTGGSGTSQLTESQIQEYGVIVTEMLKTSIMTLTYKDGDCVMESKDLKVDLTENRNQKIELIKNISVSSSKECGGIEFGRETQVEVYDLEDDSDECKLSGTKTGDILELKSTCNDDVAIVDLKAKTLRANGLFMQAVTVDREELLGYLSNIKIVYYKNSSTESTTIERTEVGNANIILNLGL